MLTGIDELPVVFGHVLITVFELLDFLIDISEVHHYLNQTCRQAEQDDNEATNNNDGGHTSIFRFLDAHKKDSEENVPRNTWQSAQCNGCDLEGFR